MACKHVYKTMKEDRKGNRKGRYGSTTYSSRYKRGRNPTATRTKKRK